MLNIGYLTANAQPLLRVEWRVFVQPHSKNKKVRCAIGPLLVDHPAVGPREPDHVSAQCVEDQADAHGMKKELRVPVP